MAIFSLGLSVVVACQILPCEFSFMLCQESAYYICFFEVGVIRMTVFVNTLGNLIL
jgi:hypothetical protein